LRALGALTLALAATTAATVAAAPVLAAPAAQEDGLTREERDELAALRRHGDSRAILGLLDEVLFEVPDDPWSLLLRGETRHRLAEYAAAEPDLARAFELALSSDPQVARSRPELLGAAARGLAALRTDLGRAGEAIDVLERAGAAVDPTRDTRDGWALGRALLEAGRREEALVALRAGADAPGPDTWRGSLARGRCENALRLFERAARSFVAADKAALDGLGAEPDVLAELGDLYLSVYGEVDDAMTARHLPSKQHDEALSIDDEHEAAMLGLARVYRLNWALSRQSPVELVQQALAVRPDSIDALLMSVSFDLNDGRLLAAGETLAKLERLAPNRRAVRAERASLAWIEHDRDEARAILARLAEEDPADSAPPRIVAEHLNEIYRFPEALSFAADACERDPGDWLAWTENARALSGVGREAEALEAFRRAEDAAEGRRDAWRANTQRVLETLSRDYVERPAGDHTFVWLPDAAEILDTYLVPFYAAHREGLAERYGHTPGPVRIEIFRRWGDFSVRSTGFEGFSALGVCFGPVVTAVSPLSELRGSFSWARTAYHEYTHVIHLSLSHNRCPRWITEGLATWEEEEKNPAWSRNMRVDLLTAYANDDLIPVRQLNRAFRTNRILFAYYQGGLLCRMLIDDVGFSPMIRLLLAFDRGLDLDAAFDEVLGLTPEEIDERFDAFVADLLEPLKLEPQWSPARLVKLRIRMAPEPPGDGAARSKWIDDWLTIGWGSLQQGRRVDAEDALRRVAAAGELPARYYLLRGQILLAKDDLGGATKALKKGIELGGDEFRARMTLTELAQANGDLEQAIAHAQGAERAFPGIAEPFPSAELKLAELWTLKGDEARATAARQRWLAFNAGDVRIRLAVAAELDDEGRYAESERLYEEANEVDPFARDLHRRWGIALAALGRHEEALREFDVALKVPFELDRDVAGVAPELREGARVAWDARKPEIVARAARALAALGRTEEARARAEEALALDEDEGIAREVLDSL